jgi:hypothetical protein
MQEDAHARATKWDGVFSFFSFFFFFVGDAPR